MADCPRRRGSRSGRFVWVTDQHGLHCSRSPSTLADVICIVVRWSRHRKESPPHGRYWDLLAHIDLGFFKGGFHSNGLLREPESEEAVVAFMHILLGCFVGTFLFLSFFFSITNSFSDACPDNCRNGFFPRRYHLGVHLRS
jgi:hypothetical protein